MKSYPEYKESNNEWLGEIPVHWKMTKICWVASIVNGSTPKTSIDRFWDGEIVWVTPFDLGKQNGKKIISDSNRRITEDGLNSCGASITPAGSIILSTRAPIGHLAITENVACTNQGCKTLVPDHRKIISDFLYYYLLSTKKVLESYGQGSTFVELSGQNLKDFPLFLPPIDEQVAIIGFLDNKIVNVDKLIEEKQRQIELLEEYRSALINQVVTKGLDPDVPMKDSGIEWLGIIPEHWSRSKIKHLCYISDGNHGEEYPTQDDFTNEENGVPFIRVTEFRDTRITKENILYITKEKDASMRKGRLQENDILFVNRGSIGKVALVTKEFEGANLNSQIAYFRVTSSQIYYRYLLFFLISSSLQDMISSLIHGGALMQLPLKRIVDIQVLCPPLPEQHIIAEYLEKQTKKINLIIENIKKQVAYLREYRVTLISDAVTGKYDIRSWKGNYD